MNALTVIVPYRHGTRPDRSRYPQNTLFVDDEGKGKKHALLRGIRSVSTEWVWLTDDDVQLPDTHLLPQLPQEAYMVILPLRMSKNTDSLLERLQHAEYKALQALTLWTADRGHAVMCSGANLMVRRQTWLACCEDLHTDMPSGDDMFLLESMKRHGKTIVTLHGEAVTACIQPSATLQQLLQQRMRWAGKAQRYTDPDIRLCGAVVLCANLLQLLCPLLLLIKFPCDLWFIRRFENDYPKNNDGTKTTNDRTSIGTALLLELLYPFYLIACLAGGLWQSRNTSARF